MNTKVMIIAGEPSGDRIGAGLAKALLGKDPSLELMGLGGPEMKAAGVNTFEDMTRWAVVGLFEVAKNYFNFRRVFHLIYGKIQTVRPQAVVLIDFPGFNLRLAKALRRTGIPVIYYVSPQIWAWGKRRIALIRRTIHRMMVILPFEENFYRREGVKVDFVGHPLADESIDGVRSQVKQDTQGMNPVVAILPGSRANEIERHGRVLIDAAVKLRQKFEHIGFVIPCATDFAYEKMKEAAKNLDFIRLYHGFMKECVTASSLAWVCSGTATLETGFWGTPMIVFYRVAALTAFLIRRLIRVPFVGLVNLVAGQKIVPELLQEDFNAEKLAGLSRDFFSNSASLGRMRQDLRVIRQKLGMPGASQRAAQIVLEVALS